MLELFVPWLLLASCLHSMHKTLNDWNDDHKHSSKKLGGFINLLNYYNTHTHCVPFVETFFYLDAEFIGHLCIFLVNGLCEKG